MMCDIIANVCSPFTSCSGLCPFYVCRTQMFHFFNLLAKLQFTLNLSLVLPAQFYARLLRNSPWCSIQLTPKKVCTGLQPLSLRSIIANLDYSGTSLNEVPHIMGVSLNEHFVMPGFCLTLQGIFT